MRLSPDKLQNLIDDYFTRCDSNEIVPTYTGLILECGFSSRKEFEALLGERRYSDIVKRAILRIEAAYEKLVVYGGNRNSGAVFVLKNLGWRDSEDVSDIKRVGKIEISFVRGGGDEGKDSGGV